MTHVIAFDALGTLFDLGELEQRISRPLHLAAAATLAGDWVPFDQLLESVDDELSQQLKSIDAFVDALPALEQVAEQGDTAWVLTNGTKPATERLLRQSELHGLVDEVHSVEEVRKYKPHRSVYELLPRGATLIAAHHWDVLGARNAGYEAVWVNRKQEKWPFASGAPPEAPELVTATRR
jgi:2-haloacid dehalogenase